MTAQLCDEVCGADFGDQRLNQRLVTVIEELGAQPHLSIPAATDGRAEMDEPIASLTTTRFHLRRFANLMSLPPSNALLSVRSRCSV
jgi:hypothetical protein